MGLGGSVQCELDIRLPSGFLPFCSVSVRYVASGKYASWGLSRQDLSCNQIAHRLLFWLGVGQLDFESPVLHNGDHIVLKERALGTLRVFLSVGWVGCFCLLACLRARCLFAGVFDCLLASFLFVLFGLGCLFVFFPYCFLIVFCWLFVDFFNVDFWGCWRWVAWLVAWLIFFRCFERARAALSHVGGLPGSSCRLVFYASH